MNFFKNTDKFHGIADSMVISLARLAAGVALARLAGAEAFAQYLLFSMAAVIFMSIPTTTMITPMVNLASGMESAQRRGLLAWTRLRMRPVYGILTILGIVAIPSSLYLKFDTLVYTGFAAAVIALLELQRARACLQVLFKMKVALVADLVAAAITAASVLLAHLMKESIVAGFWWGTAAASFSAAWMMRKAANSPNDEEKPPADSIQMEARKSGMAMLSGSMANSACSRLHPFVLSGLCGMLVLANFGVAWSFIGPMRMLSAAFSSMLRPRLALHRANGEGKAFGQALLLANAVILATGLVGILLALVIGNWVVIMVFGEKYQHTAKLLPIAIAYGVLDALTTLQMVAIQTSCTNGAATASRIRIVAAIFSIGLLVPLSLSMGAMGAYLALLMAEILYAAWAAVVLRKDSGWREIGATRTNSTAAGRNNNKDPVPFAGGPCPVQSAAR